MTNFDPYNDENSNQEKNTNGDNQNVNDVTEMNTFESLDQQTSNDTNDTDNDTNDTNETDNEESKTIHESIELNDEVQVSNDELYDSRNESLNMNNNSSRNLFEINQKTPVNNEKKVYTQNDYTFGNISNNVEVKQRNNNNTKFYLIVMAIALSCSIIVTMIGHVLTPNKVVIYEGVPISNNGATANTMSSVAAAVNDTVVEITTEQLSNGFSGQYITTGAGSGVIISTDGYIVTNHHVVDGSEGIIVRLSSGEYYDAELVATDEKSDLAVVKIEATGLKPAVMGDSSAVKVGDEVIAVGNPLGELGGSVTNGIISALDREITVDNSVMTLLQTSAAINPGNSGGGLFNMNGELVGVVNAKSTGTDIDNIGFAIPISTVRTVVADLIEVGYVTGRPALGITVVEVLSAQTAAQYGVNTLGVYIAASTRSELKEADLLVSIDNIEIDESSDIAKVLLGKEVGDVVEIVIMRDRKEMKISLDLVELNPVQ